MINVARLYCIGLSKLNYTEREIMVMPPRKLLLIYKEYLDMSGSVKKEEDTYAIDDFWGAL